MNEVFVSAERLISFMMNVLLKVNVRSDIARFVTEGLVQTSSEG